MKSYVGEREDSGDTTIAVIDREATRKVRPLALRLDLRGHSPTGFEWGYGGSGPAQTALAILADCVGDELALQLYQDFKFKVIAGLGRKWTITEEEVRAFVEAIGPRKEATG